MTKRSVMSTPRNRMETINWDVQAPNVQQLGAILREAGYAFSIHTLARHLALRIITGQAITRRHNSISGALFNDALTEADTLYAQGALDK